MGVAWLGRRGRAASTGDASATGTGVSKGRSRLVAVADFRAGMAFACQTHRAVAHAAAHQVTNVVAIVLPFAGAALPVFLLWGRWFA